MKVSLKMVSLSLVCAVVASCGVSDKKSGKKGPNFSDDPIEGMINGKEFKAESGAAVKKGDFYHVIMVAKKVKDPCNEILGATLNSLSLSLGVRAEAGTYKIEDGQVRHDGGYITNSAKMLERAVNHDVNAKSGHSETVSADAKTVIARIEMRANEDNHVNGRLEVKVCKKFGTSSSAEDEESEEGTSSEEDAEHLSTYDGVELRELKSLVGIYRKTGTRSYYAVVPVVRGGTSDKYSFRFFKLDTSEDKFEYINLIRYQWIESQDKITSSWNGDSWTKVSASEVDSAARPVMVETARLISEAMDMADDIAPRAIVSIILAGYSQPSFNSNGLSTTAELRLLRSKLTELKRLGGATVVSRKSAVQIELRLREDRSTSYYSSRVIRINSHPDQKVADMEDGLR